MKYFILFILLFSVGLYNTGQGQMNAITKKTRSISIHKTKSKKTWTFLDRVCLLGQIACAQFSVMADFPGTKPRNLSIAFINPRDTVSLKRKTEIQKNKTFLNVLYPFAISDSLKLFNSITIFRCSDSTTCEPLIYDLKKFSLTKLTVDQKLSNVLSILALERGCKVDTMANHKLRINVVLTLDSASCWKSYAFMLSYAMKVAFVIYDYVLPKTKEKDYYSIQFYYAEPGGKEIAGMQFFFDHPIFKQMYQRSAQFTETGNYQTPVRGRPIGDTSAVTNGREEMPVPESNEMLLYKTLAPVVLKKVGNMEEYRQLKDTLEWFYKERIFFRAIVGPPDSVINRSDLPIKLFIPTTSVKNELETFEENGLNVLALVYINILRPYQHFKTITLKAQLMDEKESKQITTVYYLLPPQDIKEEKRIVVYCRKNKKYKFMVIPKPEYQFEQPGGK